MKSLVSRIDKGVVMDKIQEQIDNAYNQIDKNVDVILEKPIAKKKSTKTKITNQGRTKVYFQDKKVKEKEPTEAEKEKEIKEIKKGLFKNLFKSRK